MCALGGDDTDDHQGQILLFLTLSPKLLTLDLANKLHIDPSKEEVLR